MSLIQRVGSQGLAELVLSKVCTTAKDANCYLPDFKAYGHVMDGNLYWYHEEKRQYIQYAPEGYADDLIVMLNDLADELKQVAV